MEKLKNKVMIVDDDETIILPIEMSLQERGIETISFTDGEEAIKYLKNNKVSVILLDYHMEPHINGDEFIKRVREFNKEIIIYLQTAYSEELPAMDMLEKYEIQGYIDKGKRDFERMQMIISALKQAETLELVKEQKEQLDAQEYRNQFLGNFLNLLMGEIKERTFAMSGNLAILEDLKTNMIEDKQENYEKSVQNIKNASKQLIGLIEKLEIRDSNVTIKELKNTINALYEIKLGVKSIKLNIKQNFDNEYEIIKCKVNNIIYILVDIIEELINQNEEEINILIEKEENSLAIKICNSIEKENVINKIKKIAMFDDKIEITNEFSQILIKISN